MSERTSELNGAALQIFSAADTAVPVAADLVDATDGAAMTDTSSRLGLIRFTSTGASTLTGPVYAAGWDGTDWIACAKLNDGSNIGATTATLGFGYKVEDMNLFSRIAVFAAANTTGAGTVTCTYTPIAETDH